jgi:hypothetical protein
VVYRADGNLAGGTLLISWPTFTATGSRSRRDERAWFLPRAEF